MKGHSVMVNYSNMIGCCEKMCNFFTMKKEKCPVFLTAKYNSHFGIYNKKKNKEIAGFDMEIIALTQLTLFLLRLYSPQCCGFQERLTN